MAVGDVNSSERGSGARYNDGKPDLSLIPLDIIARSFDGWAPFVSRDIGASLTALGKFQRTGEVKQLDDAIALVRGYWTDCAQVFEYGKKKYAAWNWAKGMAWSIPLACAARHAVKVLYLEEEYDAESGQRHAGHYLANLVMLRTFIDTFPEGNDLPPPEFFRSTRPVSRVEAMDEILQRSVSEEDN